MGIKIHDTATDDLAVSVPSGWPAINVSEFQKDKSLGKEVDADRLSKLLAIAANEVVKNYDTDIVMLPLDQLSESYFKMAVFELAFAKMLPSLPVNNQHDSNLADPEGMVKRISMLEKNSKAFQREIHGFNPKQSIGSIFPHATT